MGKCAGQLESLGMQSAHDQLKQCTSAGDLSIYKK